MDLKFAAFITILCCSVSVIGLPEEFCGKCSPISGVKCIDERTFAFCDRNGIATNRLASCPANMKCVNNRQICARAGHAACRNKCQQCENGRFTCISKNVFSLCFGRNQTSNVKAKCAIGKVCSTAKFDRTSKNPSLEFCFDEILLEPYEIDCEKPEIPEYVPVFHPLGPAKPPSNIVFPTPSYPYPAIIQGPFIDEPPASYCKNKKPGKYQIVTDGTCQKYYVCYQKEMTMVGDILTCAAHSVFDPTIQKCVRPSSGFYTLHKCGRLPALPRSADTNDEMSETRSLVSPYLDVLPMARSLVPDQTHDMDGMESLTPSGVSVGTPRTAGLRNLSPLYLSNTFNSWNPYDHKHPISPPLEFETIPVVNQHDFITPIQQSPVQIPQFGMKSWNQVPQTKPLLPTQPQQTLWNWG